MADNMKAYMKNLGKSIAYSVRSTTMSNMPVLNNTVNANADTFKNGTSYVKNVLNQKKAGTNMVNIMVGKYMSDVIEIKNTIFEDLRTGKINNFERVEKDLMDSMFGVGTDIDWGEDIDVDSLVDGSADGAPITQTQAIRNSAQINEIGSNFRTRALMDRITDSSEASSEYVVKSQTKLQSILLNTQAQIHTEQLATMTNTNKLLTSIFQFQNEQMVSHMDKELTYFDNSLAEMREIKELLKANSPKQKNTEKPKNAIDEVFGIDGSFSLEAYGKNVKKNFEEMLTMSGLGMVGSMAAMSGGPMAMLKSNPLGLVTDLIVSGMMPKSMKTAMSNLDSSLSGLFSTMVLKINEARDDWSKPGRSLLANLLGIDIVQKTGINVGKYAKDTVPFTGKTDKAITEVIPTLLSHILTAIKGGNDVPYYDYSTGKFTNSKKVIADVEERATRAKDYAMSDIKKGMQKNLSKVRGGDNQLIQDDLDNFINFLADSDHVYNPNKDKDVSELMTAGLNLKDPRTYNVLRAAFMNMPKNVQSSTNWKRITAKTSSTRAYNDAEQDLFRTGLSAAYSGLDTFYPQNSRSQNISQRPEMQPINPANTQADRELEDLIDQPFESMRTVMAAFGTDTNSNSGINNTSFFRQLMNQRSMPRRIQMLKEKIGSPGQLIAGMIGKLDTMIYKIIYGKEDDGGDSDSDEPPGKRNSIIGKFTSVFHGAMDKAMDFMDNKVFSPFYEKFFGEDGLFTKLQERMKPFIDSMKGRALDKTKKLVNYLLGEKKDGFYTGGALSEFGNAFIDTGRYVKSIFTGKDYLRSDGTTVKMDSEEGINAYLKKYMHGILDMIQIGLLGDKVEVMDEDGNISYKRQGDGILNTMINGLRETIGGIQGLFSNKVDGMSDETKKAYVDWANELKGFLPKGVASSMMGGAAGLFLPGGPVLGAMIGTTIGFASHSKKFREALFGNEDEEGVIPKKYVDMAKKFMPSTIAGGIIGLGASIVLPGGPLLGLLMGSAIGFVKKSSDAQKFLFGDEETGAEGYVPKRYIEAYKKHFPNVLAGGLLGLVGSAVLPGGPLMGILIGSTLGYAQKSQRFQEYLFGKEADENGNGATKGLLGKEIKKHLGKIIGGGLLGTITGMMGLPGGPTLGLMMGASFGYYTRTKKFQDFIYGKEDPETGELKGGIREKIKHYIPEIASATLGMVGVLPGGLIGGLLLGSVAGYFTRSEKFKEFIFGSEEDSEGNKISNLGSFIKKRFPLIAGGVLGAIGGLGFGILPGILLGGAVGWLAKSQKVRDAIFGKEDEDGDIKSGLVPFLTRNWKIPAAAILGSVGVLPGGILGGILLGTAINFATKTNDLRNLIFGEKDADGNQIKKNILQRIAGIAPMAAGVIASTMGFIPGGPMVGLLVGSAFGLIHETQSMQNFLFGKSFDEDGSQRSNILLAIKKYTPFIAGGLVGSLASVGLGPIPGMVIGGAVGWLARTEAVQDAIFGKKDADGKVIKKSIISRLPKLVPGLAGAILGGMGFIPGSPLVGLLVGSAFAFIAKTGNLKDALFGKKDADGNVIQKSMLQRLPGMSPAIIGGLLGQFAGLGFGPVTGILVGSAIGFAMQSQTFKELIFGKKDEDGKQLKPNILKRIGGMLPMGIGGLLGYMGIIPGGPIIGMLIGSAVQWVGKSQIFKDIFFGKDDGGDDDNNGSSTRKKIGNTLKKALPIGIFAAALSGVLPGGLITGIMLASVMSFATRLGEISNFLFGEKDENNEGTRSGGVIGKFKSMMGSFTGFFTNGFSSMKEKASNVRSKFGRKRNSQSDHEELNANQPNPQNLIEDENRTRNSTVRSKFDRKRNRQSDQEELNANQPNPQNLIEDENGTRNTTTSNRIRQQMGKINKMFVRNSAIDLAEATHQNAKSNTSNSSLNTNNTQSTQTQTPSPTIKAPTKTETLLNTAKSLFSKGGGIAKAGTTMLGSAFRGFGNIFKKFTSNTKHTLAIPKIIFMNRMLQDVKDDNSYRATLLGLTHQIAVNTVDGTGGKVEGGSNNSSSLLDTLKDMLPFLGIAGVLKDAATGDKVGLTKNLSRLLLTNKKFGSGLIRAIGKGGKAIFNAGKSVFNKVAEKVTGKTVAERAAEKAAVKVAKSTAAEAGEKAIEKGSVKAGEKAAGKIVANKVIQGVDFSRKGKSATEVGEKVGGKVITGVFQDAAIEGAEKTGKAVTLRGAKNITKEAAGGSKIVAKITEILTSKTIVNHCGKLGKVIKKMAPKIAESCGKKIAKGGAMVAAKAVGKLNVFANIAFMVYDLATGMADAKNILQIPPAYRPTLGMRVACGLGKMISGLIFNLISPTFFAELIYELIGSDEEQENLAEEQAAAQSDLAEYNAANGTNYTMDEYQNKVNKSTFTKITDAFKPNTSYGENTPSSASSGKSYGSIISTNTSMVTPQVVGGGSPITLSTSSSSGKGSGSGKGGSGKGKGKDKGIVTLTPFGKNNTALFTPDGKSIYQNNGSAIRLLKDIGDPAPDPKDMQSSKTDKLNGVKTKNDIRRVKNSLIPFDIGDATTTGGGAISLKGTGNTTNPIKLYSVSNPATQVKAKTDADYKKMYSYVFDKSKYPNGDMTVKDLKMVETVAKRFGLDPHVWLALVAHESKYNSKALGRDGDAGWGQIIPSTGKALFKQFYPNGGAYKQPQTPFTKEYNAMMSMGYLRGVYDRSGGNWDLALSKYNGGPKSSLRPKYYEPIESTYFANTGKRMSKSTVKNPDGSIASPAGTDPGVGGDTSAIATTASDGITGFRDSLQSAFDKNLVGLFDTTGFTTNITGLFDKFDPFYGLFGGSTGGTGTTSADGLVSDAQFKEYMNANKGKYSNVTGDNDIHRFLLQRLSAVARIKGRPIKINDMGGYRTMAEQQYLYNTMGPKWAAKPGTGLHELGLAADISTDFIRNVSSDSLMKYGLWKPQANEPWHVEPIESKIYGRSNKTMTKMFGTPFAPSSSKSANISKAFGKPDVGDPTTTKFDGPTPVDINFDDYNTLSLNDIGDPVAGNGVPDASNYKEAITTTVSTLKTGNQFNDEVLKILNVIAMSLEKIVSLSSNQVSILSDYIKSVGGQVSQTSQPTVAIVQNTQNTNTNPFMSTNTSASSKQDKSGIMKSIVTGSSY